MPPTREEFEASIRRYGRTVAVSAVVAFALFDGILWAILVALGPHLKPLRAWAFAFGPAGEILFALSFMSAGLLVPAVLLLIVVRRANRDPNIRCPSCGKHFWDKKIVYRLRTLGRCPRCEYQLFPEVEESPTSRKASTISFAFGVGLLCGFGVLFVVTAFTKAGPERYVYVGVAVLNFLVAGWALWRRTRRDRADDDDVGSSL